jgi:phosphoglycerate kinase
MITVRSDIAPETTAIPGLGQLNADDLAGQTVLMRIDAAVPANAHEALRDVKLKTALASLDLLLSSKARVALLCHTDAGLHNIEAQRDTCQRLAFLLGKPIQVLDECRGPEVTETVARLRHGEVCMLGNLSLEPEEEANSPRLARYLADLGDLYCNEAFSLAHEVRASTRGAVKMAQRPVAGLDFERTLNLLRNTFDHPQRPFLTVIGGELSIANLLLLESISYRADADMILVGGEVSLAFLKADGRATGAAIVTDEAAEIAARIVSRLRDANHLFLPRDFVPAELRELEEAGLNRGNFDSNHSTQVLGDIGDQTRRIWSEMLGPARTILWHGPLGLCEFPALAEGTLSFAQQLEARTSPSLHRTIVCGETLTGLLCSSERPPTRIQHLSPAGKAILNYTAGKSLSAIDPLARAGAREQRKSSVVLALSGTDDDARLASFAGSRFSEHSEIHCVYVEPGLDEDAYPDVYSALTKAERLAERLRADSVFDRADAALASCGIKAATRSLIHSRPSDGVIRCAQKLAADVIVISRGTSHNPLSSLQEVIDQAPCEVLVLPVTKEVVWTP